MASSISEFERMSAGTGEGDNYSPQALRRFIEKYFMRARLSDGLLNAAMEIKRVLLAGSTETVTRTELQHFSEFFRELKAISLELNPHVKVIFRGKKLASDDEVRQASAALHSGLMRLAGWLSQRNQRYEFAQINTLVTELHKWLVANGGVGSGAGSVFKAAKILPRAKAILVAGSPDSILGNEWLAVANAMSRSFTLYLALAHGLDENLDVALTREYLPEASAHFVGVLDASSAKYPEQQIPLTRFSELLGSLQAMEWLPESMSASSVGQLLTWLLQRPLGDGTTVPHAVTQEHLTRLKRVFNDWSTLLAATAGESVPLLGKFEAVLGASAPLLWDEQGRIIYPTLTPATWTKNSRAHMVWPFVILSLLKDSYADTEVTYFTDVQMDLAAKEILPLLQNFGWLKATKLTIGRRILREADLFTNAANGNGFMDLSEGIRYIGFVMSSFRTSRVWLGQSEQACGGLSATCVRALGAKPDSIVLAQMPRLQAVIRQWPRGSFFSYMKNAETIALDAPVDGDFDTGDVLLVSQLFQYVETFYQRYDLNRQEILNLQEVQSAYPIFAPTLEKLLSSAGVGGPELNAFFTFLFKYGDTPFTMFGGQVAYNHWRWHRESWELSADREIIMNILSQLSKL